MHVLAEDLDRVLVSTHGAVRAESEEHRPDRVGRFDVQCRVVVKARLRDVVDDAYGEPSARALGGERLEYPCDHPRGELLRREPVASADDPRQHPVVVLVGLGHGRDHIEEKRLADRAGFLRTVKHRDPLHARGQRLDQRPDRKRTVQPHLRQADALTPRCQPGDGLAHGFRAGPHHDQHSIGLRVSAVLDEP